MQSKNVESIYWNEKWNKLQEEKEKGESIEYIFENTNGKIVYPFIKRKAGILNGIEYYDLVTSRGQGGPRIKSVIDKRKQLVKEFDDEFQNYCIRENIVAEYVRFDPWIKNYEDFSSIYKSFSEGDIYCTDLTTDFFINEYSSSVRNDIRRAEKNNFRIEYDFDGNSIDEFLKIYNFTAEKYDISEYYQLNKNFIKKYFEYLKNQVFIAKVYYNNINISSAIILIGKDIVHYHFSATNPDYRKLQPNTFLIYNVEQYAKKIGKKLFDLGRASKGSNLEKFKFEFINKKQDKIYKYNVGITIRNNNVYEELVTQNGGEHQGYFPGYR